MLATGLLAPLGGCSAGYLPVDQQGRMTAIPPAASSSRAPGDTCGAGNLAYLVGKPKEEIPVALDLTRRRVICSTCEASGPPDPRRVTIAFDQASGLVTKIDCN